MNQYLLFLVLGLGTGGVYAGLALGIVVGYRGSGVINFGQGAAMTYVAYTFAELRLTGRLMLPYPEYVSLTSHQAPLGFWPSLALALLMAAVIGVVIHYAVFDRLRNSPALGKVVASLGILAVLQAVIAARFASTQPAVATILPTTAVHIFGGVATADRFWLVAIAAACGVLLYLAYRFTRFGLRTRASTENEVGAMVLGYSPSRTAAANWVISLVVSSLLGILAAPITQLTPTNFTLFIIPALGAALLANLDSLLIAVVASVALGMIDQFLVLAISRFSWLPQTGTRELVPFLVIAVAVFVRGSGLPTRGARTQIRLPSVSTGPRSLPGAGVAIAVALAGVLFLPGDWRGPLLTSLIGIIIALSFVTLTGFLGQISLSQLSTAGLAGFLLMRLTSSVDVPFPFGPVVAIIAATIIGVLVGLPALRVRGVSLAIITLAYADALDQLVFNSNSLNPTSSHRHASPPSLFGLGFGPFDRLSFGAKGVPSATFGLFVLVVVVGCALAVSNLQRSETGRRLLSVRGDESAAAMVGISVVRTKLIGLAISAGLASTAGVLLTYQNAGLVSAPQYAALMSVNALAVAYLGGITSIVGAVAAGLVLTGGIFFYALTQVIGVGNWTQLILGFALILTVLTNPGGIADELGKRADQLRRRYRGDVTDGDGASGRSSRISTPSVRAPGASEIVAGGLDDTNHVGAVPALGVGRGAAHDDRRGGA